MPRQRGGGLSSEDEKRLLDLSQKSIDRSVKDNLQQRLTLTSAQTIERKSKRKKYLKPISSPVEVPPSSSITRNQLEEHPTYSYALDLIKNRKQADIDYNAYITQKGTIHDTQIEFDFMYLQYDPDPFCRFKNVYWLRPASDDIVHTDDYFTISHRGVTQIKNKSEVEFIELETWLFEKSVFDRIVNMKCVERIRLAAKFNIWKDAVYKTKYQSAQLFLSRHSLHCNPALYSYIVTIQAECIHVRLLQYSIDLHNLKLDSTYTTNTSLVKVFILEG